MNLSSKRVCLLFVAVCLAVVAAAPAQAQEWSASQKEVWKNVEAYWALAAKGDLEGFMGYVHPDYRGWGYGAALPRDKAAAKKWFGHGMQAEKTVLYEINPVTIQVHGDFAFVHYYYAEILMDAEGKERTASGRWTDILTKQGDKWVMIGDHGGETDND
jgi:ketosteroid isomerase-like protein